MLNPKGTEEKQKIKWSCACPTGDQEVAGSSPAGLQHSFVAIDHEIFSTVIFSLRLIQEGQLSASGERMCTKLVDHYED